MKVIYIRDGAVATIEDCVCRFTGAAGSEFLNIRRTSPMGPPSHTVEVKPDTIFKIHTGIAFAENLGSLVTDVRSVASYWKNYGVRVERTDVEEAAAGIFELVVYITAMKGFVLNSRDIMFESVLLSASGDIEAFTGDLPTKSNGFVPVAKKQIQDASSKKAAPQQVAAPERSDEEKRAAMDKFLNTPDASEPAGQSVEPGEPIPDLGQRDAGTPVDPSLRGTIISKGGVKAL
jgi:hypothetical protein